MIREVDLVIVGAGFGGSLMAMVARRLGLSVLLLEQGQHPRVVIGESTTPLSNLLLERLSATYDLPRIAPLAKWGSWQSSYPEVACGLKRGFSFFHGSEDPLLVAASPHDAIADTHWYRADVDHFLVKEAQRLGVNYRDQVRVKNLEFTETSVNLDSASREGAFHVHAKFLIDATGPRGFLHCTLHLEEGVLPGLPATESLYCHFTGVGLTDPGDDAPFPADDAAVHHVFPGGWVWVLRFNNGVTSAGVAATQGVARELGFEEGEPAWHRLLQTLPALRSQFEHAVPCQPFRYLPSIGFRSRTIVGKRWAMLPSTAGFVDPLLSTGFSLNLMGIERLAQILQDSSDLEGYADQTESNLLAASRMIGALYGAMEDFARFTAVSYVYFAAVSFAETAYRLNRAELAPGFLLSQHPQFGPAIQTLLERPCTLEEVRRLIEPFNLGGFGNPARGNRHPVRAEDLVDARSKVGASNEEIVALLEKSGYYALGESGPI